MLGLPSLLGLARAPLDIHPIRDRSAFESGAFDTHQTPHLQHSDNHNIRPYLKIHDLLTSNHTGTYKPHNQPDNNRRVVGAAII